MSADLRSVRVFARRVLTKAGFNSDVQRLASAFETRDREATELEKRQPPGPTTRDLRYRILRDVWPRTVPLTVATGAERDTRNLAEALAETLEIPLSELEGK